MTIYYPAKLLQQDASHQYSMNLFHLETNELLKTISSESHSSPLEAIPVYTSFLFKTTTHSSSNEALVWALIPELDMYVGLEELQEN